MEIQTERLYLRHPIPGDEAAIFAAVIASLDKLRAFPASLPWVMTEPALHHSRDFVLSAIENIAKQTDFPILFWHKESRQLIGCGGLHRPHFRTGKFEIGFWGNQEHAGKGYMLEAVRGVCQFALQTWKANRIEALVDDENTPAIRLCLGLGMQQEGILRNERMNPDGSLRNTRVFSMNPPFA